MEDRLTNAAPEKVPLTRGADGSREARRAEALRANLRRRKAGTKNQPAKDS